jgi:hypothetical protein
MAVFPWRAVLAATLAVVLTGGDGGAAAKKVGEKKVAAKKATKVIDFEKSEPGSMPAGFTAALTGEGGPVAWMIAEDPTAPSPPKILAQSSTETTEYRFPLCIHDPVTAKDVAVSVHFKVIQGKVGRAAGLAVRLRDPDHYYVAEADALEGGVTLHKVVEGKRSRLAGTKVGVSPDEWHALKLEARGPHFVVSLDGKRLFEADDATLAGAGKVALSTRADSVTFFDNLEIDARDGRKR